MTRILAAIAPVVGLLLGVVPVGGAVQAGSQVVKIEGTVVCYSPTDSVQGVWVRNDHGTSGWAGWWAYPGKPHAAKYQIKLRSDRADPTMRLHVGCGGSASSWEKTLLTPKFKASSGNVYNRRCDTSAANESVACQPAPRGPESGGPWGDEGYCTYGAYEMWNAHAGYYPAIGGHAFQMDDRAQAAGFNVNSVPQEASMVVFNSGSFGHVGWVYNVYMKDGTVRFDYIDMNGGSWTDEANGITDKYGEWSVKQGKGWDSSQRFIVAPDKA